MVVFDTVDEILEIRLFYGVKSILFSSLTDTKFFLVNSFVYISSEKYTPFFFADSGYCSWLFLINFYLGLFINCIYLIS